ncbi:hypothetical protein AMTR_s00009p00202340 [Amborella trichopoda]|uniref:Pentacotripeptide-repeat region of PRORP domain-containing protein n=2 Tax=Amborella trichopoda TaxID=13333 RepID=W1NGM0_AMBTC|nr:hypothetical protein AMTR_s00009p00202340 [Amborella trichopoda]
MILRLARLKPCISPPSRPNSSLSHPNRAFFHSSHPLSCRSHWPNGESRSACNSRVMALIRAHKLDEARCVLESLSLNNVRTWTSLLTSYAQIGRVQEARQVFDAMPEKNIISWNSMLTGYVKNSNLQNARKLFDEMPEKNVASWNAMISGYCRMGLMREARELFELMGERNLVTWTSLISGYAEAEDYIEGWILFLRMRRDGAVLDQPGFVVGVTVASGLARIDPVQLLQGMVTKAGFDQDVIVCTSILNTYAKLGELEAAVLFYNGMPIKNEFTWATMITCYAENGKLEYACEIYRSTPGQTVGTQTAMMVGFAQNGRIFEARAIFDEILKPDVVAWNAMVTGYAQNGLVEQAEEMFNKMPKRNSVSWASMVSGYSQNGLYKKALQLFSEMLRTGMVPINPACTSAINTCASSGALQLGKQIHTLSIKIGSFSNRFLSHALIDMYSRCKNIDDAVQVFSLMREKDNISWNSLISGLSQNQMLEDARSAFETMPNHDIVSWTTMICAYVLAGHACEAQELFTCLLRDGLKPNPFTFSSILTNCAGLGAMELGKQIHGLALKLWFDNDIYVSTALINMYFKCGSIIEAFQVFDEAPEHDLAMWNSVLTGCGQHALGRQA